jgi:hypothetical protein
MSLTVYWISRLARGGCHGGKLGRRTALAVVALHAIALCDPLLADEAFTTAVLPAPQEADLSARAPQRASQEQVARYREKLDRIRTHHVELPTREAAVPFSNFRSLNAPMVKPRNEALFSDGIDVQTKIAASSLAKMDYSYVSPVAEPSAAIQGNNMLVTFNWGAVWSGDGGKSFSQLDPFALFETPAPAVGQGFCCDQVALYVPSHKLMIWLMQGSADDKGNTIRLLFAKDGDIALRKWRVHDFSPASIGNWENQWFDYPDMATTDKHLFISFNVFRTSNNRFTRSVVLRFSLDELASYGTVNVGALSDTDDFSPRFSQGAKNRMYWAVHKDTATLSVRSWADSAAQPERRKAVEIERWVRPSDESVAGSEGPNGRPWLKRLDGRITAGWATTDIVGFAWSSGKIAPEPGRAAYPFPHVRVALLRQSDLETATGSITPLEEPHIWNSLAAMAYPAAAPNSEGTVGLSLYFGGPKHYPSNAIGILRKQDSGWGAVLTVLATGTNTPRCRKSDGIDNACGAFGDYIGVRPQVADPKGWYVAVHTPEDTRDVEPKVVVTLGLFRLRAMLAQAGLAR